MLYLQTDLPQLTVTNEWHQLEGERKTRKLIEIDGEHERIPIAFVGDVGYIIGGDSKKIRRWRVSDGQEVGQLIDVGSDVYSIAVSRDGKWIVCGTWCCQVAVWDAESHEKVSEFAGRDGDGVWAVDISPDSMRIASGSGDSGTVYVWSRLTGEQLLGPLEHDFSVVAVRFSLDGQFIATATWERESVRVYDGRDGHLLFDSPIEVDPGLPCHQSLAWLSNSKQLFVWGVKGAL